MGEPGGALGRAPSKSSAEISPPLYADASAVATSTYDLPSMSMCGTATATRGVGTLAALPAEGRWELVPRVGFLLPITADTDARPTHARRSVPEVVLGLP